MLKIGAVLHMLGITTGCMDSEQGKLRRSVECRNYADKKLADVKSAHSPEFNLIQLEEKFYSTRRSSCIAVISDFLSFNPSKATVTYWIYDPIANIELDSFITQPGGADNSQVREKLKSKLQEFR